MKEEIKGYFFDGQYFNRICPIGENERLVREKINGSADEAMVFMLNGVGEVNCDNMLGRAPVKLNEKLWLVRPGSMFRLFLSKQVSPLVYFNGRGGIKLSY